MFLAQPFDRLRTGLVKVRLERGLLGFTNGQISRLMKVKGDFRRISTKL
jgi:hypothetical protein